MTTTCLAVVEDPANRPRVEEGLRQLLGRPGMRVVSVSVDDGTSKAEAVRRGVKQALAASCDIVGYVSDGFATPPGEVLRLCEVMSARTCSVLLGARVAMLGTDIHRSVLRHYLGRGFAMLASTVLGADIYDTQCGVKLFRPSPALDAALSDPFRAHHAFDVELLSRLLTGTAAIPPLTVHDIVEVPLATWDGRSGPPIGPATAAAAVRELLRIGLQSKRSRSG